jgi:hypothetical protein
VLALAIFKNTIIFLLYEGNMRGNKSDGLIVAYGPHDFPGGPENYLRLGELNFEQDSEHENIKNSLGIIFTDPKQVSRIHKAFDKDTDLKKFVQLNFINYGNTELVYKVTFGKDYGVAVLINQPHTPLGVVKNEFENLENLAKMDDRFIVKPRKYFSAHEFGHELYVTEYVPNALCIAHNNVSGTPHGVFNPNPYYHFENFSKEQSSIINSSIIALLVNYYDDEHRRGIAQTEISGNDFIYLRNSKRKDIYKIPQDLKLIAARGFVNASFEDYCGMLRHEFRLGTTRSYADVVSGKIKINHKSILPMTKEEILTGIALGLGLRYDKRMADKKLKQSLFL